MRDAEMGNEFAIRAVEKAPKLEGAMLLYWTAFTDLGSERSTGMSLGPIPRSKIKEYAVEELELDTRETDAFVYIIRKADVHFINLQAAKAEKRARV